MTEQQSEEVLLLKQKIEILEKQLEQTQKQLEKYTNNDRHKKYYEKNKTRIKANAKRYLSKLKEENPEKLKEYRHNAYLKRKEKNI
jgi:conjugal transfer/entry exclusion protein